MSYWYSTLLRHSEDYHIYHDCYHTRHHDGSDTPRSLILGRYMTLLRDIPRVQGSQDEAYRCTEK